MLVQAQMTFRCSCPKPKVARVRFRSGPWTGGEGSASGAQDKRSPEHGGAAARKRSAHSTRVNGNHSCTEPVSAIAETSGVRKAR